MTYSLGDIANMLFALVAVASFIRGIINGRKTDRVAEEQTTIKKDMKELAINTNSIKDALVAAKLLEGISIGRDQIRAERKDP